MKNLRLPRMVWILLQGVYLPLVYFSGKMDNTCLAIILLSIYEILVLADAFLTCKIFEPKYKAGVGDEDRG